MLAGAPQLTATEVDEDVLATGVVGMPGTPAVTAVEAAEAAPVPSAFVAVTVKVYAVLLVRPPTVQVVAPVVVQVKLPGEEVTVYPVMAEPPVAGAVHETISWAFVPPAAPVTPVGTPGSVAGVRLGLAADVEPEPLALAAVTEKVYAVPAVSPELMRQLVAVATVVLQLPPAGLEVTE